MANIGIVSQCNQSGHSHVNEHFARALKDEHEVFIIASKGNKKDDDTMWEDYNLNKIDCQYNELGQHKDYFKKWIEDNDIDLVVFNEMYDWGLVEFVNSLDVKTVGYIDWFSEDWVPLFEEMYDQTIICAEHTYEIFQHQKNSNFVPWGVDLELFKPKDKAECKFFHSAGWGGINFRKCTPQVVKAFEEVDETMFLHTQTPVFDATTVDRIKRNRGDNLKVHFGSVEHPGLYHKGEVYVGPSRLEGLGLYIPEALACGMPVITTDVYPMKQFVQDGFNGFLIEPDGHSQRDDGYFFPQYDIEADVVQEAMEKVSNLSEEELEEMSQNAREFMEENHSFKNHFKPKVKKVINKCLT